MKATELVQKMMNDLNETMKDAEKADLGQKAAGTRVRKAMQVAKSDAQELRKLIMENQKEG